MLLRRPAAVPAARRGSALLMAFLVLIVLAAILFQLYIGTTTDARVARNDVTLTAMDQAIESALLEVGDRLLTDAESGAASGAAGALGAGEAAAPADPEAGNAMPSAGPGAQAPPADSREDSWGRVQRTTINEIELRVQVVDEDSKINVLSLLTEDEEQADLALERVARVLDLCREDSTADIDRGEARRLAEAMREHLRARARSALPRTTALSDDEEEPEFGLAMSLRELVVVEPFHAGLFRDFRDERGRVVHSIGSFLTVWTALESSSEAAPGGESASASTQQGEPEPPPTTPEGEGEGQAAAEPTGGVAVNINTAPAAVLKSLLDDRVVPYRFWDEVIEYRNLEEESESDDTGEEPIYDEYGEEVYTRRFFDSTAELEELDAWSSLGAEERLELSQFIGTQSQVFSIYVTARRSTGQQDDFGGVLGGARRGEPEDRLGNAITRTVRSVVWRYQDGEEWKLVPLVRWEVLDYTPFEVLDFPDPDR
jgi:type II secretory pathway pseudopilin PulG